MAIRSTLMEEIHKYRRERIWRLVEERYARNRDKFARETSISSGLLHDALNKNRNFGERIARRIEEKLGLTPGWLDQPLDEPAPKPSGRRKNTRDRRRRLEHAVA